MTDMSPERDRTGSVVGPFRASIVRQECAVDRVAPMFDALPASERAAHRGTARGFDPDAYEELDPALFVYRLRRGDQEHVGVVADVRSEAFVDGRVRGHEAVHPDRVAALVDHFSSVTVRSELVALLHRSGPAVDAAVTESLRHDPLVRFTGADGWEQTVWRVPESVTPALSDELSRGVHYIADGHHRVAASLNVWHRAGRPHDDGVICVVYPLDGLRLLAFHRRVIGPVHGEELFRLLSESFAVSDISHPEEATGCFALYIDGRWYDATYKETRLHGVAGLDVSVLNTHVVEPLLGPAALASPGLEIASALSPLADLTEACDRDGGALFALRPPSLDQLIEVADRGEVMPPKTTYFDPKPSAGIFLR